MSAQLDLYNAALLFCGERFLGSLTENREPRRLLDQVWATGGVKLMLEKGQWNFATRTQQLDFDSGISPGFGYQYAFDQPDDYCNTRAVCADEYFRQPLIRHVFEGGYWYADLQTIYVRYVSDDVNYGMNMNKWPQTFLEVVACHFASKIVLKLGNDASEKQRLETMTEKLLKKAKNSSAMQEPTQFPAPGSWSRSRQRYSNYSDGGNGDSSGSLIG